jgi:hypothetical protein
VSYTVTITNSTASPITAGDGSTINPNGGTWTSGTLGDTYAHSDQLGSISFIDLGDKHIGGDSGETWGVLITYQGDHMVGRYEGGGKLAVTFNAYLQATLSGMDLRLVELSPFIGGTAGSPEALKAAAKVAQATD